MPKIIRTPNRYEHIRRTLSSLTCAIAICYLLHWSGLSFDYTLTLFAVYWFALAGVADQNLVEFVYRRHGTSLDGGVMSSWIQAAGFLPCLLWALLVGLPPIGLEASLWCLVSGAALAVSFYLYYAGLHWYNDPAFADSWMFVIIPVLLLLELGSPDVAAPNGTVLFGIVLALLVLLYNGRLMLARFADASFRLNNGSRCMIGSAVALGLSMYTAAVGLPEFMLPASTGAMDLQPLARFVSAYSLICCGSALMALLGMRLRQRVRQPGAKNLSILFRRFLSLILSAEIASIVGSAVLFAALSRAGAGYVSLFQGLTLPAVGALLLWYFNSVQNADSVNIIRRKYPLYLIMLIATVMLATDPE